MESIEKYLNKKGELNVSSAICQMLDEELEKESIKNKSEYKKIKLFDKYNDETFYNLIKERGPADLIPQDIVDSIKDGSFFDKNYFD
jgi:hypothetical protein